VERAGALLRGRTRISTRLSIIRESIDASGGELNAALTRYWLEPSEGGDKAKLDRLRQIHERLEKRRKEYEKEMRDYSAGKIKQRPGKPDLIICRKWFPNPRKRFGNRRGEREPMRRYLYFRRADTMIIFGLPRTALPLVRIAATVNPWF
jgi:hypothetical protein